MINIPKSLLEAVQERLREFGIALEVERQDSDAGADAVITLSSKGQRQRYAMQVKAPMTVSSLAKGRQGRFSDPQLIIGDQVSRRSADAFRTAGVQFVDGLGNAFITFGSVFVEVQGRTESTVNVARDHRHTFRQQHPTNLFSSRRSQVILALLAWPELSTAKVREIASAAGVSIGQAHETLFQLQQSGFLVTAAKRWERVDQLLELWTAAYPTGLGARLEIARYHGDPARPIVGATAERSIHLSGESAEGSGVMRPATLTVYLDSLDAKFPILNRWDASPDREPNIFVRQKFWTPPHIGEKDRAAEVSNAPWPLVYADLIAARDARLSEVAEGWRTRSARFNQV